MRVQDPHGRPLEHNRGDDVRVPAPLVGEQRLCARATVSHVDDGRFLALRHVVIDERIPEHERGAHRPGGLVRRAVGAPGRQGHQFGPLDATDQHLVEARAHAELLGRASDQPGRRADLPEPAHRLADALEPIGPADVALLDHLALALLKGDKGADVVVPGGQAPQKTRAT